MARHEDMHDVEMDEREELPTSIVAAAQSRLRRSWPLAAGLVAVLLGGLAVTQVVLDARERARLARLAQVPGVLQPLDASVGVLWTTDDQATPGALDGSASVGDLSVGGYVDEAGERTVRAVRTRTGEVAWSTVVGVADPAARLRGTGYAPACSANDPADVPRQVVCLVTDSAYVASTDGPRTPVPATFARLVVIDPSTGKQRAQRDVPTSVAIQVGSLDGLVVMAWRSDEGHLVVSGTEPLMGDARWRFESPEPLAPAPADEPGWRAASGLYLSVAASRVVIAASGGELWVLSGAGTVIHQAPAGSGTQVQAPRPGVLAILDVDTSTGEVRSQQILRRDGTTSAPSSEPPVSLTADDDSVPNLLFTVGDRLHAWDMATGQLVWATELQVGSSAVLLDGRLYARSSGGHLLALDAATGATLWDQPVADTIDNGMLFTDGRSLLAARAGTGSALTLVAFAPSDGRRIWEAPLPDSVGFVWELNHQLVGISTDASTSTVLG